jgi:hypothetical protein
MYLDSIDDKNDNIIKEMTNDLIYSEDLLMNKNEQFDLDLQVNNFFIFFFFKNLLNFYFLTL